MMCKYLFSVDMNQLCRIERIGLLYSRVHKTISFEQQVIFDAGIHIRIPCNMTCAARSYQQQVAGYPPRKSPDSDRTPSVGICATALSGKETKQDPRFVLSSCRLSWVTQCSICPHTDAMLTCHAYGTDHAFAVTWNG